MRIIVVMECGMVYNNSNDNEILQEKYINFKYLPLNSINMYRILYSGRMEK